ncbi:MAG TPA: alpha/beta hydrolase family protein [Chthoniobacter sp.]|nr:alpha/beta hydrolase family protein [Chthoniobacter sp.]
MKSPLFVLALAIGCSAFAAEIPRVLPAGELPKDVRLEPLKDLNGYFPFTPSASPAAWAFRAEEVRRQVKIAMGIWPEPTRTPLNAVVYGKIEGDGYTIEKVYFESMPGFFVTGSLFRPREAGRHPAVLCPHGHWKDARFIVRGDAEMKKELDSGGERSLESGRSMFQSLGIQLARMGIVAFVYDMLGNSDSNQISYELAHGFAKQRPEMNTVENWGLFSPQAETRVQSIAGLQTWNSMRIIDFLDTLPDVDPKRIGVTGASGGGTQTMVLSVVDPRVTVECPAVMVSTAMQGGCTCENASLLRVGTGNVEFAAVFAPKPLGMTAANDWTKEMETKGFPELQQHYAMMGAPKNVALWAHLNFGHNYNIVSREHIYSWFNEHFHLGLSGDRLKEQDHPVVTREQLTVWDAQHPEPPKGDDFERQLLQWWAKDAETQLTSKPKNLVQIAQPAWQTIIGWTSRIDGQYENANTKKITVAGQGKSYDAWMRTLKPKDRAELPMLEIQSSKPSGGKGLVLWLDEHGKAGLFTEAGELRAEVCRLLEAGYGIMGVDLFEQGEFLPDGKPITQTRRVKNPREAASYTFGYNRALFAQRVSDICDVLKCSSLSKEPTRRSVVALDSTGPLAAVALAIFGERIDRSVINTGGFRFGKVLDLQSPDFLPGAAKYGDIPAVLKLAPGGPQQNLVLGEGEKNSDPIGWLIGK